jgi:hypothetical protein
VTASQAEQSLAIGFGGVATSAHRIKKIVDLCASIERPPKGLSPWQESEYSTAVVIKPGGGIQQPLLEPEHRIPDHT